MIREAFECAGCCGVERVHPVTSTRRKAQLASNRFMELWIRWLCLSLQPGRNRSGGCGSHLYNWRNAPEAILAVGWRGAGLYKSPVQVVHKLSNSSATSRSRIFEAAAHPRTRPRILISIPEWSKVSDHCPVIVEVMSGRSLSDDK